MAGGTNRTKGETSVKAASKSSSSKASSLSNPTSSSSNKKRKNGNANNKPKKKSQDSDKKKERIKKKKAKKAQDAKIEGMLAASLFGDAASSTTNNNDKKDEDGGSPQAFGIIADNDGNETDNSDASDDGYYDDSHNAVVDMSTQALAPAWDDSDDEGDDGVVDLTTSGSRLKKLRESGEETEVTERELERRLKRRMKEVGERVRTGFTSWADVSKEGGKRRSMIGEDGEDSSDDEYEGKLDSLLNSTAPLGRERNQLPAGEISMVRGRDFNEAEASKSTVTSCKFHPSSELVMTAGYDKTLRFFRTGGDGDAVAIGGGDKIHGVFFGDM
ncbi:hypothetical protein TrRE_jg4742, partial [Triparma retinervis]